MKKLLSLILILTLCISMCIVFAATDAAFLVDGADLLSDSEEAQLQARLEQLSRQYGAQVTVITTAETEGSIDTYIEYLYDNGSYGYGDDRAGVMLVVAMDIREFRILSNGFAAQAITMDTIDSMTDSITPWLSDGDYSYAFDTFADDCDYYLNGYLNGFPFNFGGTLLLSVIVGLVAGLIVALILKGQLKSVRKQYRADTYVKPGSLQMTQSGDFFMYRSVSRTPKPQSNSSSSSSGSSRNVGGGSF